VPKLLHLLTHPFRLRNSAFWQGDCFYCSRATSRGYTDEAVKEGAMAKKILLVDDSTTTLMMEEMILKQRTSYVCVTAKDGVDAISRAVVENPDLVLMDVVMPRMNGFEACKRMRLEESLKQVPIILVTTRSEQEYVDAGFQSGCNDYITKPINDHELVTLLQSYLGE
jgi:CheY-like chemotaxis protein